MALSDETIARLKKASEEVDEAEADEILKQLPILQDDVEVVAIVVHRRPIPMVQASAKPLADPLAQNAGGSASETPTS